MANDHKHWFSVVLITWNEANNIEACLSPLLQISDDVLVLDAYSEDDTPALAKKMGAWVIQKKWEGYAQNKNYANAQAHHDWILSIDADEIVSEALIQTLKTLEPESNTVYELDRLTNYCGKWIHHSGWYPDWKVRLFNRNSIQWQGDFVHETLAIPKEMKRVRLEGKLLHYSYKSSEDHLQRIDRYAALSAKDLYTQGKKAGFFKLWVSPVFRFLRTLIISRGFMDGKEGWIISMRGARLVRTKYRLLREMWRE